MAEKANNWSTPSMREYVFWHDGMTPDEFEKEYQHYHQMMSQGKMSEYKPLWRS